MVLVAWFTRSPPVSVEVRNRECAGRRDICGREVAGEETVAMHREEL